MGRRVITLLTLLSTYLVAHGQDAGKKPVLPHTGAITVIDAQLYNWSDDYGDIFTGDVWREVNGEYMRLMSSSGAQWYMELVFLNGTDYILQNGYRSSIADRGKGKDHIETAGTWNFDSDNAMLTLYNEGGDKIYTVDYFTTAQTAGIRCREILTLTYTGQTEFGRIPTITFIR